jgi:N-acetylglucosaminyldiphosphoundecaprenol N-acetyl-beta-D-mannosaminyltransferase
MDAYTLAGRSSSAEHEEVHLPRSSPGPERIDMFGVNFDAMTMAQAVDHLLALVASPDYRSRYVVTPNVDHVVKLRANPRFQAAYRDAELVLVDGKPVRLASRLLGTSLPETVPGSDLVPALFAGAKRLGKLRVFLLGSAQGVPEIAAERIQHEWPWVEVVGVYSPPMGFSVDMPESETAVERIRQAQPDVLVVGLGAPRQEIWVHAVQGRLCAKAVLCVGATIDFLARRVPRAPLWMRRAGIEWLHRIVTDPRRMLGRYAYDAVIFPLMVTREWWVRRS